VSTTIVNQNYGPGAHEVIWRVKGQTRVRSIGMSDDLAFEHDRHGEIVWGPPGATLTEARRALEAHGHTGLWAVMP
jgi:hypothetical protein